MRVAKWGNSLAVRLPAEIVKRWNLGGGEEMELDFVSDSALKIRRKLTLDEADAITDRLRKKQPIGWKIDRSDPAMRG